MNATAQSQLDIGALKQAFEANDVDKVLQFYSEDLEHVEIDPGAPPKSPRTSDFEHLGNALRGAAQAGIKLRMENPIAAADRAACTISASSRMVGNSCPTRSIPSRAARSSASSTFR